MRDASTLTGNEVPVREVNALSFSKKGKKRNDGAGKQKKGEMDDKKKGEQKNKDGRKCYRCDSDQHMANSPKCPAANKTCNSCSKTGHFAKVCRSGENKEHVREVVIPELTTLLINDAAQVDRKIKCTVEVRYILSQCR